MSHYDHAVMMHYKLGPWDAKAVERRVARDRARQARLIAWLIAVLWRG